MRGVELESLREISTDRMRFDMFLSDYRKAVSWAVWLSLGLSMLLLLFLFLPYTGFCEAAAGADHLHALECNIVLNAGKLAAIIALAAANIVVVPRFLAKASGAVHTIRRRAASEIDRVTTETVSQDRPFVLYLRPFLLDEKGPEIQLYVWSALHMHLPVVAIGNDPNSAIYQFQSSAADWQDKFKDLARRCLAIIIVPFATPSTAWELQWIIKEAANKTIVLMPPTRRSNWYHLLTGTDLLSPELTELKSLSPKTLWPTTLPGDGEQLRMPQYSKRGAIFLLKRSSQGTLEASSPRTFDARRLRDALLEVATQGSPVEPVTAFLKEMKFRNAQLIAAAGQSRTRRVVVALTGVIAVVGGLLLTTLASRNYKDQAGPPSKTAKQESKLSAFLRAYGGLSVVLVMPLQDRRSAAKRLTEHLGALEREWASFVKKEMSPFQFAERLAVYLEAFPELNARSRKAATEARQEVERLAQSDPVPIVEVVAKAELVLLDCEVTNAPDFSAVGSPAPENFERLTRTLLISSWRRQQCAYLRERDWTKAVNSAFEENVGQPDLAVAMNSAIFELLRTHRSLRIVLVEKAASDQSEPQYVWQDLAGAVASARHQIDRYQAAVRRSFPDAPATSNVPRSPLHKLEIANNLLAAFDQLVAMRVAALGAPMPLDVERQIDVFLEEYHLGFR